MYAMSCCCASPISLMQLDKTESNSLSQYLLVFSVTWCAAEEALPQMADASGGPMASYMREVKELRKQMAAIPQLSKKKEFASQELLHLPQTPGRLSKLQVTWKSNCRKIFSADCQAPV